MKNILRLTDRVRIELILNMGKQSCILLTFEHMVLKEFTEILNSYNFSVSQTSLKILKLLWRWVKSLSLRFWQQSWKFLLAKAKQVEKVDNYIYYDFFFSRLLPKKKQNCSSGCVRKTELDLKVCFSVHFICYANVSSFFPLFFRFSFRWVSIYRLSEFLHKLSCHFDDKNHETAMRILCFVCT